MITARAFRALCCGALAAAGCASPDDAPVPEAAYGDGAVLADPDPGSGSDLLDPNLATAAALAALPGMTDSVTLAVIAGRPYRSMLGLERVLARHMSAEWRDSVYTRVWLPLDINTASSDEIMLIPGVDTRLRYELEEFRPYDGIEEFRREMGEQLGPEEAERLERYIILP
jgi:DNA uptake protein ComE-like DNA-binding protein